MTEYTEEFIDKIFDRSYLQDGLLPTPCYEWSGARSRGYGYIRLGMNQLKTHRVVCEYYHGPIPKDKCVMHLCDNTLCVNPDHLQIGTNEENVQDAINKGRRAFNGDGNPSAKLTLNKVMEIRQLLQADIDYREIAVKFNVSRSTIQDIKHGRSWRNT